MDVNSTVNFTIRSLPIDFFILGESLWDHQVGCWPNIDKFTTEPMSLSATFTHLNTSLANDFTTPPDSLFQYLDNLLGEEVFPNFQS